MILAAVEDVMKSARAIKLVIDLVNMMKMASCDE